MPDFDLVKELDPKLRRLVRSRNDPARLSADRDIAFVTAEVGAHETTPHLYHKRVLVMIDSSAPPTDLGSRWHQIVEGIYTVDIRLTELEALAAHHAVKFVEAGRPMRSALDTSVTETRSDLVRAGLPGIPGVDGTDVVVGIIDIGFDYTLSDFGGPAGTRIAFLWDQSLTPLPNENSPGGFGYGVEYTAAHIDAANLMPNPFAVVRHRPQVGAHGTHVAGTAVGNGSSFDAAFPANVFVGVAPGARVILVQPGIEANIDTFADSARIADAVDYIFARAQQLGLPCVINMSLGQNGGSHDGESVVERAIDRLLEQPGRAFVVAGGNEHVFRTHASGTLAQGQTRTLHWRVGQPPVGFPAPPAGALDRTPNEMEIWCASRDVLSVRVIDPAGRATGVIAPGSSDNFTIGGNEVYIDSERFTRLNGDARIYIEMSAGAVPLQTGIWRVELTGDEIRGGRFDAWIERDARDRANGFADQSSFDGADFDPSMTLGTPATGRRAIAVANYDHRTQTPNQSSGRGRTRDGRNKPEVAAPGTAIVSSCAMGGRPQPGGTPPMRIPMSGTSMAAPHVTGIVALLFQRARTMPHPTLLTAEQTRKLLIATTAAPPGVQGFDEAWGFGRVDAEAAVKLLA